MTLGALVLVEAAALWPDFQAFYGHEGIPHFPRIYAFLVSVCLFGLLPVGSMLLIIGAWTAAANLLCFVSLLVIQNANGDILQGGDVLLRLLLFWSLFLPLGQFWSVDSLRGHARSLFAFQTTFWGEWAFTLQVCFVYWAAALLKRDPAWTENGHALFNALSIEHFTTPFGLYLRQFHDLLRWATKATPWFEFLGPVLLFLPSSRGICRMAAVTLFVAFHLLGLQLLFRIGMFPEVCASAWLAFIPSFFWDRAIGKSKAEKAKRSHRRTSLHPAKSQWTWWNRGGLAVLGLSFLDVVAWNFASVSGTTFSTWLQKNDAYAQLLRLDQRWNMYAPHPRVDHGWLVVPADFADGSQIDLFTGKPVFWDKPQNIGAFFGDDRWRRYLSNLFNEQDPAALEAYAGYLVRRWNNAHDTRQQVQAVTITYMKQLTQPDFTLSTPERNALYFHAY